MALTPIYDISLALHALVPGARYRGSLTANNQVAYESIIWLPEEVRPQPSWADVHAKATELSGSSQLFEAAIQIPISQIRLLQQSE